MFLFCDFSWLVKNYKNVTLMLMRFWSEISRIFLFMFSGLIILILKNVYTIHTHIQIHIMIPTQSQRFFYFFFCIFRRSIHFIWLSAWWLLFCKNFMKPMDRRQNSMALNLIYIHYSQPQPNLTQRSRPAQFYVRLSIKPLSQQANHVSSGIIKDLVVAFLLLTFIR